MNCFKQDYVWSKPLSSTDFGLNWGRVILPFAERRPVQQMTPASIQPHAVVNDPQHFHQAVSPWGI
jgi:hypothetical protein